MTKVFISHVHEDQSLAIQLAEALESSGFSTWYYERDCLPGPSYLIQTGSAVEQCDVFLVIVSPNSLSSHQVTREVVRAHECNKAFMPVLSSVSHAEFQTRQPEWREAIGSATSVDLDPTRIGDVANRVINGIKAMELSSSPASGDNRGTQEKTRIQTSTQNIGKSRRLLFLAYCGTGMLLLGSMIVYLFSTKPVSLPESPISSVAQTDSRQQTQKQSSYPSIAVLEFENNTTNESLEVWKKGLREFIVTDIISITGLRVVERARLQELLAEMKLAETKFIDPTKAVMLGKGLSAHWVLTGSYAMVGEELRLDIKLLSVEQGTVEFASSITGKPTDIVKLERTLVERLAKSIRIDQTGVSSLTVIQIPTPSLQAFLEYSEAIAARDSGDRIKAQERLRAALKADSQFALASAELSNIELEGLTILNDINRLAKANAGEVVEFLRKDLQRRYSSVAKRDYDGHYFANLLVISTELGLFGDHKREMAYLLQFWRELTEHIPYESVNTVMITVNAEVEAAGREFQKRIDSGNYDITWGLFNKTPAEAWLPIELRTNLDWPLYSTFFPFSNQLRRDFGQITIADTDKKAHWQKQFSKNTPTNPIEYLDALLDDSSSHRDGRRKYHFEPKSGPSDYLQSEYQSLISLRLSVLIYYYQMKDIPPVMRERLARIESSLVRLFENRLPLEKVRSDVLLQALSVFRFIAKSTTEKDVQAKSADIAVQITRQLKLNAGVPNEAKTPIEFFGITINCKSVVFMLCQSSRIDISSPDRYISDRLVRTLRSMGSNTQFNIYLVNGMTDVGRTCFTDELSSASPTNIAKSIDFVKQRRRPTELRKKGASGAMSLEEQIEQLLERLPVKHDCEIFIIAPGGKRESGTISQNMINRVAGEFKDRVRVHAIVAEPSASIGKLVACTHGTAYTILTKDILQEPTTSRWNVSEWATKK